MLNHDNTLVTNQTAIDIATAAVAFFSGMQPMQTSTYNLWKAWQDHTEMGGDGLFARIATVSSHSERMLQALTKAVANLDFPGVYLYEVLEETGSWFAAALIAGDVPSEVTIVRMLGQKTFEFFQQSDHGVLPSMATIIFEHSGYSPLHECSTPDVSAEDDDD